MTHYKIEADIFLDDVQLYLKFECPTTFLIPEIVRSFKEELKRKIDDADVHLYVVLPDEGKEKENHKPDGSVCFSELAEKSCEDHV